MNDWIVTLPKHYSWEEYKAELSVVADGSQTMYFRVLHFPKKMTVGDRCFLTWNGYVRGWMLITSLVNSEQWRCTTTGVIWPAGKYIGRSGAFHPVDGPEFKGFQGVRRFVS